MTPTIGGGYWSNCGFELDQKTSSRVLKDLRDITQKVFLDRGDIPQWFYDEYQKSDGSINLDKLWADIPRLSGREKSLIIYGLRNEFGGYCSTEDLYRLHIGEIEIDSLDTPWKDAGGCPTETEIEPGEEEGDSEASSKPQPTHKDIVARDTLIAAQESLLNIYRCRFDIDTEAVPGGCVDEEPAQKLAAPDAFGGTPTEDDIRARDDLIAAQESLLNIYRCRFDIDTEAVPGGCINGYPRQLIQQSLDSGFWY